MIRTVTLLVGWRWLEVTGKSYEGIFWRDAKFYMLIGIWVIQLCAFLKTLSGPLKICDFSHKQYKTDNKY